MRTIRVVMGQPRLSDSCTASETTGRSALAAAEFKLRDFGDLEALIEKEVKALERRHRIVGSLDGQDGAMTSLLDSMRDRRRGAAEVKGRPVELRGGARYVDVQVFWCQWRRAFWVSLSFSRVSLWTEPRSDSAECRAFSKTPRQARDRVGLGPRNGLFDALLSGRALRRIAGCVAAHDHCGSFAQLVCPPV